MRLAFGIVNQGSAGLLENIIGSWKMDEASGNLIDEVSAQSITAGAGWTYSQTGPNTSYVPYTESWSVPDGASYPWTSYSGASKSGFTGVSDGNSRAIIREDFDASFLNKTVRITFDVDQLTAGTLRFLFDEENDWTGSGTTVGTLSNLVGGVDNSNVFDIIATGSVSVDVTFPASLTFDKLKPKFIFNEASATVEVSNFNMVIVDEANLAIDVSNRIETPISVGGYTEFSTQQWFNIPSYINANSLWCCDTAVRGFTVYWNSDPTLGHAYDGGNFQKFTGLVGPTDASGWHNLITNVYNSGSDLVIEVSLDGGTFYSRTISSASIATHCDGTITLNSADSNGNQYNQSGLYGPFHVWNKRRSVSQVAELQTKFYDDFT